MSLLVILMGLCVGILVGLFGIGGGLVLVPALALLLGMEQHMAQGTSLFILLPPLGLGALAAYWKRGQVDLRAGILCALGMLLGSYAGSLIAMPIGSTKLKGAFGCFLMISAVLLWRKTLLQSVVAGEKSAAPASLWRQLAILVVAAGCGIAAGLFGAGGGVLLVPALGLFFDFDQLHAQGTSLIALVPPTGALAVLSYWHAGNISWRVGLLLMPGIFLGGIAGSRLADVLHPRRMRQIFAAVILVLGAWQAYSSWFS